MNAAWIKARALELGGHLVGIAPAARLPEAEAYRQWLARGFAGDMTYLSRHVEQRADCRVLFPPARTVVVCGLSYHSPAAARAPDDPTAPYIARYARGDDYHTILKDTLYKLLALIRDASPTPVQAKVCVDTVPILERLYGYYAGLGWIGKHGGLINERYGSWFFLGELLLDLELEPDAPVADRCGACTRCLDVCPTGALIAPRILDARRCISYLTIELKGAIPPELRPALGSAVFGCDRCQQVCPWNHHAAAPALPAFRPRVAFQQPDLRWLLSLTPAAFNRAFKNNPVKRTKLCGLLRNAAIVAGNSGDPAWLPLLHQLAHNADPLVQAHAAWAIDQLT